MGETALVESMVADAISLIKKMDSLGTAPSLVVWYFYDDAAEWRLLVAGPAFDALLPKQEPVAYRRLVEVMASIPMSTLTITDVKIVDTKAPLLKAIRSIIGTGPTGIAHAHFSDTSINGIFIKQMIILRSA